jgi:hypothetical protein
MGAKVIEIQTFSSLLKRLYHSSKLLGIRTMFMVYVVLQVNCACPLFRIEPISHRLP